MSIKGFAIYFDNVYPVEVIDIEEDYLNVKFGQPLYGSASIRPDSFFNDEESARNALRAMNEALLIQYKTQIKDSNDLVSFALNHTLQENDIARTAFIERAAELGFTIKNN